MGADLFRQSGFLRHFRHATRIGAAALTIKLLLSGAAAAQGLAPYKDAEFAFPGIVSGGWEEGFVTVAYDKMRDIHQRDEVPEKRVKRNYVSLTVRDQQADLTIPTPLGDIKTFAAGRSAGARFIVIYIHGQGGSRRQGVDDYTFGGNFNRIKNLAARNGGLYLSPDGRLKQSEAYANRVPVYIGHGSDDSVFAIAKVEEFHRQLAAGGYPARMVRFETGSHGTPIRMTDWRQVLNWMFAQ
ncbi:MAG: alpha/beta hydrolase [Rhizobiaceae bacterium]|nr:alpha/beta hydrolase [Rhizobiaceae bacterium]